jgi:hypothetical protein
MSNNPLPKPLRTQLERSIAAARKTAEIAARTALNQLAVSEAQPFVYLSEQQRLLRRRLRAHARQLGDARDPIHETQEIKRLVEEVGYEHWHRMLFARFLAENNLLVFEGVPVTIAECEELAAYENVASAWEYAGNLATKLLPQVFKANSVVFDIEFAPEHVRKLEEVLSTLPREVFLASDSLGWVYQFWQAENKDHINKSGNKIGADELPAVTQLFTEDYMVDFLLDNTLGAWHAGKVLATNPSLAITAQSEVELREAVALPGCDWNYLRFIKSDDGIWAPASGTYDGWPKTAKKLKCLDPCMGSGHFIVSMFDRMVALRTAEEGRAAAETVSAVIAENIHGLELDARCTQIAAFNLALTAWRKVGYCSLPAMHLACSGLSPNAKKADWIALAGQNERLRNGMERLYQLFENAPVLGSLINPRSVTGDVLGAGFDELQPLLSKALNREVVNESEFELVVAAQGIAMAAEILAGEFTLVATNVPYLGRGKQDEILTEYCERIYPEAKADLAACFIERCIGFCNRGGTQAIVTPQNLLFLQTYKKLRFRLLNTQTWNIVARLGEHGFDSSQAAGAFTAMMAQTNYLPLEESRFVGIDVANCPIPAEKATALCADTVKLVAQADALADAEWRIILDAASFGSPLRTYATALSGCSAGDGPRFIRLLWEVPAISSEWEFHQSTVSDVTDYGGKSEIIFWEQECGEMYRLAKSVRHINHAAQNWLRGKPNWRKLGVVVSQMRELAVTLYLGDKYDCNCCAIVPNDIAFLPAIWAYCSSPYFNLEVRKLNQKLNVTPGTLLDVPFDLSYWQKVAAEKYPTGLSKPFSSDPTQWLFNGYPFGSDNPLHVAIARLCGYQWPRQTGSSFPDCPALEPDGLEVLADSDGIVCIPVVGQEQAAADRLLNLLAQAYGDKWSNAELESILSANDCAGKSLTSWLRDKFFAQHCKLFHHRPFIWHVWDGTPDGFSALINYHKLDYKMLETLIYTYLGDWISRQRTDIEQGVDGAQGRLAAAENLKKRLELILNGEAPYDIFVRWKSIMDQPVGWNPDINDGVRMNIRPFLSVPDIGKKGAGVLREKPNIKWDKDRGKDVASAPWYHLGPALGGSLGDRINDHHLTLAEKKAARGEV